MIDPQAEGGLCASCGHGLVRPTARGTRYLRCLLASRDPSFEKYPRLPVLACRGYEPRPAKREGS